MIAITGGEPLVRNDLEECGRKIYERGFPWGIVSNGYALTSDRLSALCGSGLRSITISLDGLQNPTIGCGEMKNHFKRPYRPYDYVRHITN